MSPHTKVGGGGVPGKPVGGRKMASGGGKPGAQGLAVVGAGVEVRGVHYTLLVYFGICLKC